jgi:hypothetical protein
MNDSLHMGFTLLRERTANANIAPSPLLALTMLRDREERESKGELESIKNKCRVAVSTV